MTVKKDRDNKLNTLADKYVKQQKFDLAEKYYDLEAKKGCIVATNKLAIMYEKQKKYDQAEKYYSIAADKGNSVAMNKLAIMYEKQKKSELAEKYYGMAVKKSNHNAIINLANMYNRQKKYKLAKKYYIMAVDKGIMNAIYKLAKIYEKQNNYELAEKFYVLTINKSCKEYEKAIKNLEHLFDNKLKYFLCLTKIKSSDLIINKQIKQKINHLMANKSVYCFANKLILNTKIDDCPICMTSQSLIPYSCSHFLCPDCYVLVNKCPICNFSSTNI